jgi:hypothetical protein
MVRFPAGILDKGNEKEKPRIGFHIKEMFEDPA